MNVVGAIVLTLCTAFGLILNFMPTKSESVRIYYMKYGGMYCGHMEITPCGVRLSKCTDTRIYECLHDVAYEDEKPAR